MRRKGVARKIIDEELLNSEDVWNAIRYLDPDSDHKGSDLPAVITVLLVALLISAVTLCLHFRGI
jgi:hypothetical protein